MSKFKKGEIAIIVKTIDKHKGLVGLECEIISDPYLDGDGDLNYDICINGRKMCSMEHSLRKKKPPEASWEEIQSITNWHPQKVTA